MKIFSFSSGAHDSSYAIYDGREISLHDELERHTRIKECNGDILEFFQKNNSLDNFDIYTTFPHFNKKWYPKDFEKIKNSGKFIEVGHHQSHAANAFFSSKFKEALIITIDGGGWDRVDDRLFASTITVWEGRDTKIHAKEYLNANNLGVAWQEMTRVVFGMSGGGPPYGCQAGTVMAMAAFGNRDSFPELTIDIFKNLNNLKKYTNLTEEEKFDFAARFQSLTEQFIKKFIANKIKDHKYLCLAGGTVLNSVMTGKIWDWFPQLEGIYIPPVPYDAGLAIGNIQYILHHMCDKPREEYKDNFTPYLGRTYNREEIEDALRTNKERIKCRISSDEEVARLLTEKNIVSVFNNGSESGRRALGNRSILADPRFTDMKDIINEKVKHRQPFRPFAPSVLKDRVTDWFDRDIDSPYMQFVVPFKESVKEKVPAVVHVDGSARLQTVSESDNKWYYNFIKKFESITNVPIVLNTSFNDREPIVETPHHAINCFMKTNIDYLYFAQFNILVEKNESK